MNRLKHAHLVTLRTSKKEPLTEDIRKKTFSEEELQIITSQRALLIAKNLTDGEVSRELSKQLNHHAGGIDSKIRQLVKSGQLPKNPNKQEQTYLSDQELQIITSQRPLLIAKNLTDGGISIELSKLIDHPAKSIEAKIRRLVKTGKISENPNKREREVFTDRELQTIASQRPLLIAKNLTDGEISRELSKLIDHSARSIETKISRLVKSCQLPENPSKQEWEVFTDQDLQKIISQRSLLIAKNLADHEISRELSKQLNRSAGGIKQKISRLVQSCQLPENPNKEEQVDFSEQDLQKIIFQRPELIAKNLTDYEISREISKLIDHSAVGISHKIRKLVKSAQLPENPNKREQEVFTDQDLQKIISQRPSLIAKNLTDHVISRELSKLIGHPASSIGKKIRKLVKSGKLPENPNKLGRKPTENELLSQLVNAVDTYTGEKNE